ncbi:hypothetical protein, partial [Melaminivora alkalimesophila]|uniref:hypothetical protein n=1 Tax=Melaminivora alkalimesophila TaxID=1165852 RepID=UPI0011470FCD
MHQQQGAPCVRALFFLLDALVFPAQMRVLGVELLELAFVGAAQRACILRHLELLPEQVDLSLQGVRPVGGARLALCCPDLRVQLLDRLFQAGLVAAAAALLAQQQLDVAAG